MRILTFKGRMQFMKVYETSLEQHHISEFFQTQKPYVLAFDQSTEKTGVTVGTPDGILGNIYVKRGNFITNSRQYIAEFETWLPAFTKDVPICCICHEDTHSSGYFKTDRVLSALRSVFATTKELHGYDFPIYPIKSTVWKSELLKNYHCKSHTKENTIDCLCDTYGYKFDESMEDLFDSIGIYLYWFNCIKNSGDTSKPYRIHTNLKKSTANAIVEVTLAEKWSMPNEFNGYMGRGVREFEYDKKIPIPNLIQYIVGSSNKIWYGEVPVNAKQLEPYLSKIGHYPIGDEKVWLTVMRKQKAKIVNEI